MEWLQAAMAFLGLLLSGFSYVLWQLYVSVRRDVDRAMDEINAHKLHVAETYVTQAGLTRAIENLDKTILRLIDTVNRTAEDTRLRLEEINARIDRKADKP